MGTRRWWESPLKILLEKLWNLLFLEVLDNWNCHKIQENRRAWTEICSLLWSSQSHRVWPFKDQDLGLQIPKVPGFVPCGLKQIPTSQELLVFLLKLIWGGEILSLLHPVVFSLKRKGLRHCTNPKTPEFLSFLGIIFRGRGISLLEARQSQISRCDPTGITPHSCHSQPAEIPIIAAGWDLLVFSPKEQLGYGIFPIFRKDVHNTAILGWFLSPKWENSQLIQDISLPAQGMLH